MNKEYTLEELQDITQRKELCAKFLDDNQMTVGVNMTFNHMGDGNFCTRPVVFFKDSKFDVVETEKSKKEKVKEVLEAEVKES